MRVLHVVPSYIPAYRYGGPIMSVHGLCKGLAALGHEITLFTTNVDGTGNADVPTSHPVMMDGVRVHYFPSRFFRRLYYSPQMRRALCEVVPQMDIVHTHSVFLWPTWAAARAARAGKVPYVVSPRGMLVKDLVRRKSAFAKKAWIRLIERQNIEAAAAVHVTSGAEADELAAFGFKIQRLLLIPNGVDCPGDLVQGAGQRFRLGWGDQEKVVLFLGRVSWKKGLDRLIRALVHVPGARLVVAGNDEEGYGINLLEMAKTVGVAGRVKFAGPVYGQEKWNMLQCADCFVLPSYSENFGNAVLEAMAAGCPVVVTSEVGMADVVQRSGAGLVTPGDPLPLGQAIARLLADVSLRADMARAGKRVAREEFGWDSIARQMAEAYKSVKEGMQGTGEELTPVKFGQEAKVR